MKSREQANSNNKITIKQFQWYQVQTKVREIMGQLLQPFNKKQTQQSLKINDLKRNFAILSKRLDDHDFLLQRQNSQKPKYIQLQDQKINEINKRVQQSQVDYNIRIKAMQVTIQVYKQKINQLNSLQKRIDDQILNRVENFNSFKNNIDGSINLMMKKIQNVMEENNLLKNNIRTNLNKFQTKMIMFQNRIKDSEDQLKRKSNQIKRIMDDSINHNQRIVKLQLKQNQLVIKVQDKQKDTRLSQKFFSKVKQVENDLLFLHKYLQSYQPLYIQLQISQTLNSFIKGRQRRLLCIYQQKRYSKLHNNILMNDSSSLQQLMSTYSEQIRKIINRNRKYIINLKVQQSIRYGTNVYEIRIQDDTFGIQDDDQKKNINMIVPQAEIQKVLDQKWKEMQDQIKNKFKQTIKSTNDWMKQLQEQSFIRFVKIQTNIQQIIKQSQQIKASIELTDSIHTKQLNQLKQISYQSIQKFQLLKSFIRDILNFNSVLNHIVIQDQIDRQGTALYALKGKQQNHNSHQKISPTIQLDLNCVSCNQDIKTQSIIQKAFKMACLTYNPSEIKIDDQYFTREEILEISTNILERLKNKMDIQRKDGIDFNKLNFKTHRNQKEKKIVQNQLNKRSLSITTNQQNSQQKRKGSLSTIQRQGIGSFPTKSKLNSSRLDRTAKNNDFGSTDKDNKNFQTLLPILGGSKKSVSSQLNNTSTQKNNQFSVFY